MQEHATVTSQEIAEHLHMARENIHTDWFERLERCFGAGAPRKMVILKANREVGQDLFSLFLESMKQPDTSLPGAYESLFLKIRSLDYSITDFFNETFCLEQSLEHFLRSLTLLDDRKILDGMALIRQMINEITGYVLNECTQIFEYVAETSKSAFCQTDADGLIVFANRAMERLAEESPLVGKPLVDLFRTGDRRSIQDAVMNRDSTAGSILRVTMRSAKGRQTIVGAEVGPVIIDDAYLGGYAHITDMTFAEHQHHQLYDRALLGMVNLNRLGEIVFANKSLLQMLNMDDYQGVSIFDILPDDKTRQFVREQLYSRFGWKSNEYPLELKRLSDGALLPVMVSAFPQTDLSGRCVIGSFAILRSQVGRRMHYHIERNHDEVELLQGVMRELALVIPYDLVAVSKYSSDRKFSCSIFSQGIDTGQVWQRRWWKLTPAQIKWAERDDPFMVENLDEFLKQPDWCRLKEEEDIKSILKQGFCSLIFFPIIQNRRLVAAVTLMSKSKNAFKKHHLQLLNNLPIKSAVYMALYYNKRKEKTIIAELIMKLTREGNNLNHIANVIVTSVSDYFQRKSVCIFKLNRKRGTIQFVDQAQTEEKYKIQNGYEQKIEDGVLGYVCKNGTVENIGDSRNDERFKTIYKNILAGVTMRSELCIPISFGGTLWLLNIEDEQIRAFSDEEQEELTRVMNEVGNYLEKTWLSRFLEASLESSSDAVLVTDCNNRIIQVNPTAEAILPIPKITETALASSPSWALQQIAPTDLREIFVVPAEADGIIAHGCAPITNIRLKRRGGGTVPVVLTVVDLLEDFGHTIYLATDLTAQQRMEEIEGLEKIYHELAVQTKTPLSLALGWLDRLKRRLTEPSLQDQVDASLRQLKKLELTYNRIAMYADGMTHMPFNPTLLDLTEVINDVRYVLPISEQDLITWPQIKGDTYIEGDLFQLRFCLETIFSYLLRFTPAEERIELSTKVGDGQVQVTITGRLPRSTPAGGTEKTQTLQAAQVVADLAFGEPLIHQIIIRHGGHFSMLSRKTDSVVFHIDLPLFKGGHHEA